MNIKDTSTAPIKTVFRALTIYSVAAINYWHADPPKIWEHKLLLGFQYVLNYSHLGPWTCCGWSTDEPLPWDKSVTTIHLSRQPRFKELPCVKVVRIVRKTAAAQVHVARVNLNTKSLRFNASAKVRFTTSAAACHCISYCALPGHKTSRMKIVLQLLFCKVWRYRVDSRSWWSHGKKTARHSASTNLHRLHYERW